MSTKSYTIDPQAFDGEKFRRRYGLQLTDFYVDGDQLVVRDGITLPDDPPVFEPPDPPQERSRALALAELDRPALGAIIAWVADKLNVPLATAIREVKGILGPPPPPASSS